MQVEHERDQGTLEPRAHSPEDGESRAGDLCCALEVENAQRGADVPVRERLEIEPGLFAPGAHDRVVRFALPDGGRGVRYVWHLEQALLHLCFRFRKPGLELFDLGGKRFQLVATRLESGPVAALGKLAHLLVRGVAAGLQVLGLADQFAAARGDRGDRFDRLCRLGRTAPELVFDLVDVVGDVPDVEHVSSVNAG